MSIPFITAHISVYSDSAIDLHNFRHTTITFKFSNPTLTPLTFDITGASGFFTLRVQENIATTSATLAGTYEIGQLLQPISTAELVAFVAQTPIDNASIEFNCQNWVESVVWRLRERGLVSEEMYEGAVDGMVEIMLEARDG